MIRCATIALFVMTGALPSPLLAAEAGIAPGLELSAVVRVRVARVEPVAVGGSSIATGVVAAYRKATVSAEVPGRIIERLAEPGTQAQAGATLVHIDADRLQLQVRQAKALARARRVDAEHAQHEYQRGQRLFARKVISEDTVDDLRFADQRAQAQLQAALVEVASAERNLRDASVTAPFDGQIEHVHVQVGDYVNPGQPIVTQTDFSKARLIAGVSGSDTNHLSVGDTATVAFDDLGGSTVQARITSVGRIKEQPSGTYPVELELEGLIASRLREGMVANIAWQHGDRPGSGISMPAAALIRRSGQIGAYVIEDNIAELRNLRIGKSDGRRVEVLSGLAVGEEVVIEGQFALRDGARVEVERYGS